MDNVNVLLTLSLLRIKAFTLRAIQFLFIKHMITNRFMKSERPEVLTECF